MSDDPIGVNIPIPDPSVLTTRQLQREIFSLRELLEVELGASDKGVELLRTIIETRLNGMDKAIELLQDSANRLPARIDEKISALREVHDKKFDAMSDTHAEKFSSIQTQFKERDVRAEQTQKDGKVAVDAALQAAKEAVAEQNKSNATATAKSESATTKLIDQLSGSIQTMAKGVDDKFNDVKDRITRIEGSGTGTREAKTDMRLAVGLVISLGVAVLALIGFVIARIGN